MSKHVYVIAGPNGAGKTTFAREFLPRFAKCQEFVNADLIATGLAPFSYDEMKILDEKAFEQLRSKIYG